MYLKGKGVVLSEPSVVVVEVNSGKVVKVGREAQQLLGRTPAGLAGSASDEGRRYRSLRHDASNDKISAQKDRRSDLFPSQRFLYAFREE